MRRAIGPALAVLVIGAFVTAGSLAYALRAPQHSDPGYEPSTIWLASPDHRSIDKVNGLVDAPAPAGSDTYPFTGPATLIRLRDRVVIVDPAAGRVATVDDATLGSTSASLPSGTSLATDGSTLFRLSPGEVVPVDANSLAAAGPPIAVDAVEDPTTAHGALWLRGADGVDEIEGSIHRHVAVPAGPGLAISRDGVAALDPDGRTVRFLRDGAVRRTVQFPPDPASGAPVGFAVAPDSDTVALLDGSGRLRFFDPDRATRRGTRDLQLSGPATPYLAGDRAYVARGGELLVADLRSAAGPEPVVVSRTATAVHVVQTESFLWANTDGPDAVAIHDGQVHHLVKYAIDPAPSPTKVVPTTIKPTTIKPTTRRPSPVRTTRGPRPAPSGGHTSEAPDQTCRGRKARISVSNADQTGGAPVVVVHLCTRPAASAQYWIVVQATDGGRWWAKKRATASGTYTVRLGDGAQDGSTRTFYLVEAGNAGDIGFLENLAANDDGDGAAGLSGSITKVSNGVLSTR